jgi:hypothetical protein
MPEIARNVPLSLHRALATLDLSWADLRRSAEQIILFGSRAARVERDDSDWDLLCVGSGRSRATPALDLIWVEPRDLDSEAWLTGELAGHVAHYGCWLEGTPGWTRGVACGTAAAVRKARRLASRLTALERAWRLLPPPNRSRHRLLVRRDLQRYELLARGEPVPPSRLLDEAWGACGNPRDETLRLGERAGIGSVFFERILAAEVASTDVDRVAPGGRVG